MDILIIISTQFLLFLDTPFPDRFLDIAFRVFAADHEADLAGRVRGDGGVGVFDNGEDFFTGSFERGDQGEVEPLVLSYYFAQSA